MKALVGGEWAASRRGRFTLGETTHAIRWIAGWVVPRTDLDNVEKKNSCLFQDLNSDPSVAQPAASHYTDCATSVSQEKGKEF
jgi:hypothetical protein